MNKNLEARTQKLEHTTRGKADPIAWTLAGFESYFQAARKGKIETAEAESLRLAIMNAQTEKGLDGLTDGELGTVEKALVWMTTQIETSKARNN
jgi:hypothetical protein